MTFHFGTYPNPSNGIFDLSLNLAFPSEAHATLFSSSGKIIASQSLGSYPMGLQTIPINFQPLNDGIYILHLKTNEGISTKKIVIQH